MSEPYQKWHEECVLFLDDCFASDSAVAMLSPHFKVEDFREHFPDTHRKGKENSVVDRRVIALCHDNGWLLLTTDHEMRYTHLEDIKAHPHVTILATAHNSLSADDSQKWLLAVVKLEQTIRRHFKKKRRPWFAVFNQQGTITSLTEITQEMTTRRTKRK